MRRFILILVALFVLIGATTSFAEAEKKAKAAKKHGKRHHKVAKCTKGEAGGPFADVPKGHWAYDAVQKSAESGILQGWDNRFHGNKIVNRYQMAVVVARMLDRVGVLKANGKVITAQDIANLESLTIEFADELALLNVKVSTLEDTVAGLKKDVDLIKADLRGVGARAGITGTMSVRGVFTDDGGPNWANGAFTGNPLVANAGAALGNPALVGLTGAFSTVGGPLQSQPYPGATTPIVRYRGAAVSGNGLPGNGVTAGSAPYAFASREFFSVSNFAINIDREFDPKIHFHSQLNVNTEGYIDNVHGAWGANSFAPNMPPGAGVAALPMASGRGDHFAMAAPGLGVGVAGGSTDIMVNEAYVVFDDWFTDGVNGRLGVFALPMNTEVNGPSRTYQWTITPSIANTKWESLRPVGLDIFQHNDKDELVFYVGFFTPHDMVLGVPRSGTLLSAPTGFSCSPVGQTIAATPGAVQWDPQLNPGTALDATGTLITQNWGFGRFPTPMGFSAMTDAPYGTQTSGWYDSDDIGFYAMIGTHPTNKQHTGFDWHIAYFDRNGDIRATSADHVSLTDWYAWQLHGAYQWEKFYAGMNYYEGRSANHSLADFNNPTPLTNTNRNLNSTPFANLTGEDTVSKSWMGIVNWQFNKRGSLTARYENAQDKTGRAKIEASAWTLGANYKTSDHGWLQLEWISPKTKTTSENGWVNSSDVADDLVQLNYKLNW